jgi:hypothetical protein
MSNYRNEYKNYMEKIKLGETSKITERLEMTECTPTSGNRERGFLLPALGLGVAAVLAFLLVMTVPNIRPENDYSPAASDYENLYPLTFSAARINTGARFIGTAQDVSFWLPHATANSLIPEMGGFAEARASYTIRGGELQQVSVRQSETERMSFLPPRTTFAAEVSQYEWLITHSDTVLRNALLNAPPIDGIMRRSAGFTLDFETIHGVPQSNRAAVTMWLGERTWFDMAFYGVDIGETPPTSYVHGVPVVAWTYNLSGSLNQFGADFFLNGNTYAVRFNDIQPLDAAKLHLTRLVNTVISTGGMNISEVATEKIFEFRNEFMTMDVARQDPRFGDFVPTEASFPPARTVRPGNDSHSSGNSARRIFNQYVNELSVDLFHGDIHWQIEETNIHPWITVDFGSRPPIELTELTFEDILESTQTAAEMFPGQDVYIPEATWTLLRLTYENTMITIRGINIPPQLVWDIIQDLPVLR